VALLTGILGGGIGIGYYSFISRPTFLKIYAAMMAILYPLALTTTWKKFNAHVSTLPLEPRDGFPEFAMPLILFNMASWISVLIVDKVFIPEYTSNALFMRAWNLSALCPCILAAGAVCQITNFPEKFMKPGLVNIIGHSHQLWHLCGAVLMWVWVEAITTHHLAVKEYIYKYK
jgi:hypothetical protein